MKKKYRVTLTEEERGMLKTLVSTGKAAAPLIRGRQAEMIITRH